MKNHRPRKRAVTSQRPPIAGGPVGHHADQVAEAALGRHPSRSRALAKSINSSTRRTEQVEELTNCRQSSPACESDLPSSRTV
jgi:hypothetical protein